MLVRLVLGGIRSIGDEDDDPRQYRNFKLTVFDSEIKKIVTETRDITRQLEAPISLPLSDPLNQANMSLWVDKDRIYADVTCLR